MKKKTKARKTIPVASMPLVRRGAREVASAEAIENALIRVRGTMSGLNDLAGWHLDQIVDLRQSLESYDDYLEELRDRFEVVLVETQLTHAKLSALEAGEGVLLSTVEAAELIGVPCSEVAATMRRWDLAPVKAHQARKWVARDVERARDATIAGVRTWE